MALSEPRRLKEELISAFQLIAIRLSIRSCHTYNILAGPSLVPHVTFLTPPALPGVPVVWFHVWFPHI